MKATILLFIFLVIPALTIAHPGNTDKNGCHRCITNCPAWSIPWGMKHCHTTSKKYTKPKARNAIDEKNKYKRNKSFDREEIQPKIKEIKGQKAEK